MNFWGSETQPAATPTKASSTVLGMPVTENGGFYQQLNQDISVLRKQVDKKLRDMMVAGQNDLQVLNTALKDLQIDESIADGVIQQYPESSFEHQHFSKYGDLEISGADSNVTERAANLSKSRRKKPKGAEVQLIGIVKPNDVLIEGDEEEEVESRDENERAPYSRSSIMDAMSESSRSSVERQDNLPDKVVNARHVAETYAEREGVIVLDDEVGSEDSKTVDLISLEDYEATGQYVEQRVALADQGMKSDDVSSATDDDSGVVSKEISTRATRHDLHTSSSEKQALDIPKTIMESTSKLEKEESHKTRDLRVATSDGGRETEETGDEANEKKKRTPKEPTPRMTTAHGDHPWLFDVPRTDEEKSTGSDTSSRQRKDPDGQETATTETKAGGELSLESKAVDPNEHNKRIADLLSLANQWSQESSSREPPAKSPTRSTTTLLDKSKRDKEQKESEGEETKKIANSKEGEEQQTSKKVSKEQAGENAQNVKEEVDKEDSHIDTHRPTPESPRRMRKTSKSAKRESGNKSTIEEEFVSRSEIEEGVPKSRAVDQASQTTEDLAPLPKTPSMSSDAAGQRNNLSSSEPKRSSSATRQRKSDDSPTTRGNRRRRQTPTTTRGEEKLDRSSPPPVQELVFDPHEDSDATDDLDMDGASHHRERMRRKRERRNRESKRRSEDSKASKTRGESEDENALALYKGKKAPKYEFVLPPEVVLQNGGSFASSPAAQREPFKSERVRVKKPREHIGYENRLTVYREDKKKTQERNRSTSQKERQGKSGEIVSYQQQPSRSPTKQDNSSKLNSSKLTAEGSQMVLLQQVQNKLITDPYGDDGRYTGVMVGGSLHGQGTMHYKDGRVYSGEWKHGRWHGHGHAVFANRDSYVGQYSNDQRHGHGRYEWSDGRVYDGGFKADHREGAGTYTWPDGAVYTGEFHKGLRHGKGRYIFSDGSVYSGQWQNGKYHGQGECIWADGRRYRGQWVKGQAQGFGVEHRPDGTIRHEGEWKKDRPVRKKPEES